MAGRYEPKGQEVIAIPTLVLSAGATKFQVPREKREPRKTAITNVQTSYA